MKRACALLLALSCSPAALPRGTVFPTFANGTQVTLCELHLEDPAAGWSSPNLIRSNLEPGMRLGTSASEGTYWVVGSDCADKVVSRRRVTISKDALQVDVRP